MKFRFVSVGLDTETFVTQMVPEIYVPESLKVLGRTIAMDRVKVGGTFISSTGATGPRLL